MTDTVRAIETSYAGCVFRSRLEARWAAMFDLLGWKWEYEPFDGNGYIPDFVLCGTRPVLIEVKPDMSIARLETHVNRVEAGIRGHWSDDYLIVGATPFPEPTDTWWWDHHPPIGVLGEAWEDEWAVEPGAWHICVECDGFGSYSFFHTIQSYASRICGHYDGDHYLGAAPTGRIAELWRTAHTSTRWMPA